MKKLSLSLRGPWTDPISGKPLGNQRVAIVRGGSVVATGEFDGLTFKPDAPSPQSAVSGSPSVSEGTPEP